MKILVKIKPIFLGYKLRPKEARLWVRKKGFIAQGCNEKLEDSSNKKARNFKF